MTRSEPIRKEPSGRYVVVLDTAAPGEPRRQTKRRFDTHREARAWLSQKRTELAEQRFVRPQRTTLSVYVDDWLPVLRSQVRASTADSYERNLQLHVLPALGSKPLQSIRPADLTALYGRLLQSGKLDHRRQSVGGLSPRSVGYVATIVGKVLEAAVRGELIASNPARRAEVPKSRSTVGRHAAMRTWTREELSSFLSASQEHRHHTALATAGYDGATPRRGTRLAVV